MVLLPVVERELRAAARGRAAYRVRFYAVLLTLALLFWFRRLLRPGPDLGLYGMELMELLTVPVFIFSLSIGVLATADCVSSEKREGTLGLLFLTDLKGYDVICGKLAANSLNAFYALVAILPVLSLPVMLGGVTFTQFVKTALTLFCTMILSLSAGIFVSTYSRNERKAMFFTVLLLLAIFFLPILLTAWEDSTYGISRRRHLEIPHVLSGLRHHQKHSDLRHRRFPAFAFWLSILWQWLLAAALIARGLRPCSALLGGQRGQRAAPLRRNKPVRVKARLRKKPRLAGTQPLSLARPSGRGSQPAERLAVCPGHPRDLDSWPPSVRFEMTWPTKAWWTITIFVLHVPLQIWIAAEASRRFSEDRSNNTFETLLSTPLTARQIIQGQWLALFKQFAGPIALVLVWESGMQIHNSLSPVVESERIRWPTGRDGAARGRCGRAGLGRDVASASNAKAASAPFWAACSGAVRSLGNGANDHGAAAVYRVYNPAPKRPQLPLSDMATDVRVCAFSSGGFIGHRLGKLTPPAKLPPTRLAPPARKPRITEKSVA